MSAPPLFGYGTFRRTAWREAILGCAYPCEPATLRGYRRIATVSGYLTLRETLLNVGLVEGVLVEIDELGWQIADAWEEVPKYRRVTVTVNSMRGPLEAVTYVCDEPDGPPVEHDRLALLSDVEVTASIDLFGDTMRALRGGA